MLKKPSHKVLPRNTVSQILYTLRSLGPHHFLRLIFSMIFSVNHYYLLGKNLSAAEEGAPERSGDVTMERVTEQDLAALQEAVPSLGAADQREVLSRLFFYQDFGNCYVMKKKGEIVYLQWVIFPAENPTIAAKYPTKFYPLSERQVMIENAFTFPRHRGKGFLLHGTRHLLQMAKREGYSCAICYIRKDRIPSLNEFSKMGFRIVKMLTEYKILGWGWRTL